MDQDRFLLLQSAMVDKTLMCPDLEYEKLEKSIQNSGQFAYPSCANQKSVKTFIDRAVSITCSTECRKNRTIVIRDGRIGIFFGGGWWRGWGWAKEKRKIQHGKIEGKKIHGHRVAQKKCFCIRKKIFLQGICEQKNSCSWEISPSPHPHNFSNGPSLNLTNHNKYKQNNEPIRARRKYT